MVQRSLKLRGTQISLIALQSSKSPSLPEVTASFQLPPAFQSSSWLVLRWLSALMSLTPGREEPETLFLTQQLKGLLRHEEEQTLQFPSHLA